MAKKTKLVIVESPAKAKTIGKYLGKTYKVEASQGHVRDLPKSQLGVMVDQDFEVKYITIRGRGDIMAKIRKEAKKASQILLATDPDREGEAISWHLATMLNIDPNSNCRVEFNEITKTAVKEAMKNPRPIDMDRVNAQQARRVLDRLVGYKISPLLWAKIKKGLSAGRVQSVATKMVVEREEDILAFMPEEYWDISTKIQVGDGKSKKNLITAKLSALDDQKAVIQNEEEAKAAQNRIEKAKLSIASVKQGERRKMPAPPFITSSLQQEASRKLGFSTSKTMQVVQQLYEGIDLKKEGTQGLVTYIRTDSVRVSDTALNAVREYIPKKFGLEYLPEKPNEYKGRKNAQDAHEAIRPTEIERTPESIKESLTKDQFRLYKLIYLRFLASQMKPAVYDTFTAEATGEGVTLRFYAEQKKFLGFTSIYEETLEDQEAVKETAIPTIHVKDKVTVEEVLPQQHFTQPPPRFTEASLIRTLEEKGIGRPSTYAPTITTITARGYVTKEQKRLYPTELGAMVTQVMEEYFAPIVETEFTAEMETQLDEVEEGEKDWHEILRDFYPPFEKMLEKAEAEIEKIEIADEVSDVQCENCGAMMVYKMGRFGRFLACPNFPECRNTKPIITYIDVNCPKCQGRLMEKISKKNRKFYGCENYPGCDFVSWEKPVKDPCPVCGSYMTEKRNKKGEVWHVCANENCRHKIEVTPQEEDEA